MEKIARKCCYQESNNWGGGITEFCRWEVPSVYLKLEPALIKRRYFFIPFLSLFLYCIIITILRKKWLKKCISQLTETKSKQKSQIWIETMSCEQPFHRKIIRKTLSLLTIYRRETGWSTICANGNKQNLANGKFRSRWAWNICAIQSDLQKVWLI